MTKLTPEMKRVVASLRARLTARHTEFRSLSFFRKILVASQRSASGWPALCGTWASISIESAGLIPFHP
jgi:hypothetical protein